MDAKREYRDRDDAEVAVLDALVDRSDDGMTVFELRSHTDLDIDAIEGALANLKQAGLIDVEEEDGHTRIYPDQRVVPEPGEVTDERSLVDRLRDLLSL